MGDSATENLARLERDAGNLSNGQIQTLIGLSYATDALLLAGFAVAGVTQLRVALIYLFVAWSTTYGFYIVNRHWPTPETADPFRSKAQVWVAAAIQLTLAAMVPRLAFLPLTVLFVVFALGSLGLSMRAAKLASALVSLAIILILGFAKSDTWVPLQTELQRGLVAITFCITLSRCILLGTLGRRLRAALARQHSKLTGALDKLSQRDRELALYRQNLERTNATLHHQATHDALTGLPNRLLFADRVEQAIARAARDRSQIGFMVIDLDRFKVVNDTLGHGAGDQLLCILGQRLASSVRGVDTVARVGGDEFFVALVDVTSRESIEAVARKLLEAAGEPCTVSGALLHPTLSIGISVFPADGERLEQLLARADEAMYAAKQAGRNAYRFFDSEAMTFRRHRLQVESDLRRALANNELELHYQPKVDLDTGTVTSVEALLRWHHPTRGLIPPAEFIPVAEETGLMMVIGGWVLNEACRQARAWQVAGLPFVRVAVNLSAVQFQQLNLLAVIRDVLAANSLEPRYLELEVTESTVMRHAEGAVKVLIELSRMGVIVSLDDFGTGYSSMSYLRRCPLDKLKIDQTLIEELVDNSADESIVRAIISLAHSLKLKVVAEGVETVSQLDCLRRLGCDQYQGYYNSPAVPAADIPALIRRARADTAETQSRLSAYRPSPAAR